ncbi:tc3 transposase domain-containing protein [Ditylenchus destructor]|nr:tc3 transposase domain-containing protein [Ditylenchus destructor]
MPRGTQLTDIEKGRILEANSEGKSNRWISQKIGRSEKVIRNFLKDPDGYGTHNTGGPKRKLSDRTERAIFRAASNSTVGSRALQREFAPGVHYTTVFRAIRRNPHLVRRAMLGRDRLNSRRYQRLLSNTLLPYVNRRRDIPFVFQQDNATCHVSFRGPHSTTAWFNRQNIARLPWPPCSPDMNPVEHVFAMLVRTVYANGRQYQSRDQLENAIFEAWRNLPFEELRRLVTSMPCRVGELFKKEGKDTHY